MSAAVQYCSGSLWVVWDISRALDTILTPKSQVGPGPKFDISHRGPNAGYLTLPWTFSAGQVYLLAGLLPALGR